MAAMGGVPLAWTVPAFGFSESMTRPVNKSPLDTRRLYSGTNFAADDAADRAARITNFQSYAGANPGAMPGGTGATGLRENDAAGWSRLLEQQQQYLKDLAAEAGKAGPSVRVGAYDGGSGGYAAQSTGAKNMPSANTSAAMKGLSTALDGGGPSRMIMDDPDLYHAYEMMLLDEMQGRGREARASAMSPVDAAMRENDTRLFDMQRGRNAFDREQGALQGAFNREQDDLDTMQNAASKFHAWDSYGRPQMEDTYRLYGDLADRKGVAATLDDEVRAGAQRDVAGISAGVQDRRTQSQAATAAMQALGREVGNQRQYSRSGVDPNALGTLNSQLGVGGASAPAPAAPGGAPAPTGATGGKTISRAQAQQVAQQRGWDEATLQRMLQQWGYTVQ